MNHETMTQIAGISGLLLFIAAFACVMLYALSPSNREKFRNAAHLPLAGDHEGSQEDQPLRGRE